MFKTFTAYSEGRLDQRLNEFAKNNQIVSFSYSVAAMGATQVYSVLVSYQPCSEEEPIGFDWENVPDDRDWIEMVRVDDPRSWTDDPDEIAEYESRGLFKRIFGRKSYKTKYPPIEVDVPETDTIR